MARVSSLLGLSLILGSCSSQINAMKIKMVSKLPEAVGARVELECETNYPEFGVYWIRKSSGGHPHFVLYITSRSKAVPADDQRYEISKTSTTYKLTVKTFTNQDEGTYNCIVLHNQRLYISPGIAVFLQVRTTPAPKTQWRAPNTSNQHITGGPNKCSDATVADPYNGLMFPCDPYIWIPLSGGCFLLLIALAIIITVCCDPKRRRRRCKCKRPLNGTNGKPTVPR